MTTEEAIRNTIQLAAQVAKDGMTVQKTLYGKEAIEDLARTPEAVVTYILNGHEIHLNSLNTPSGTSE